MKHIGGKWEETYCGKWAGQIGGKWWEGTVLLEMGETYGRKVGGNILWEMGGNLLWDEFVKSTKLIACFHYNYNCLHYVMPRNGNSVIHAYIEYSICFLYSRLI